MKKLPLFILALCFLASCGPDSDNPGFKSYDSLQTYFNEEGVPTQNFTVNSSNDILITTAKGNKVIFNPNAFVTYNNTPVSGLVNIELKEITNVDEMILSNKQTVSTDGILESQGEFFVGITQNGNKLKLAPNEKMRIEVVEGERNLARKMQVYNGKIRSDNSIIWTQNLNPSNYIFVQNSTNNPIDSAAFRTIMYSDSINWINFDYLFNEPRINYSVNMGNTPDPNATLVYVQFSGRKSIAQYNSTVANQMIAAPVTLIGIAIYNNELYSSFLPVTLTNNGTSTLNFTKTNEAEIKEKLRLLK